VRLQFSFANGTPPVDFTAERIQATPVELLVSGSGSPHSRSKALNGYVRSLDFLFRGVSNIASGDITSVSIEKGGFGKMLKDRDSVTWTFLVHKSFLVIYDLSLHSLTENMYVADAIAVGGKDDFNGVTPIWIKELLDPKSKNGSIIRDHTINAVSVVTEFVDGYQLVFGKDGADKLSVVAPDGRLLGQVEEMTEDEAYILVKLLTLMLGKGAHHGVFLIDCKGFSDRTLSGFTEIARLFFGDTFIFLYNLNPTSTVERSKVELPNFLHAVKSV
jgi:hypothetical protein